MINYSTITTALAAQLKADASISETIKEKYIERGGTINEKPDRAPWIGIYRSKLNHDPRTLGSMNNWESTGQIRIAVQQVDMKSGMDCEDRLEALVQDVLNAIIADTTIGGTVDMVNKFAIDYRYLESDRKTLYFQMAIITMDFEVATS